MRYSKQALLVFGAGLVLGLIVVAAELPGLARIASLAMALGIILLPLAVFADWRRALLDIARRRAKPKPRQRRRPSRRRRARRQHR
jgi:hypothetical protein